MTNNALQRYRTVISPGGGGHRQYATTLPQIRMTKQMDAAIVSAARRRGRNNKREWSD